MLDDPRVVAGGEPRGAGPTGEREQLGEAEAAVAARARVRRLAARVAADERLDDRAAELLAQVERDVRQAERVAGPRARRYRRRGAARLSGLAPSGSTQSRSVTPIASRPGAEERDRAVDAAAHRDGDAARRRARRGRPARSRSPARRPPASRLRPRPPRAASARGRRLGRARRASASTIRSPSSRSRTSAQHPSRVESPATSIIAAKDGTKRLPGRRPRQAPKERCPTLPMSPLRSEPGRTRWVPCGAARLPTRPSRYRLPRYGCWFYIGAARSARTGVGHARSPTVQGALLRRPARSSSGSCCVPALQPEHLGERRRDLEVPAGHERAAVDDRRQHRLAVVLDEDLRAAGQHRMVDAERRRARAASRTRTGCRRAAACARRARADVPAAHVGDSRPRAPSRRSRAVRRRGRDASPTTAASSAAPISEPGDTRAASELGERRRGRTSSNSLGQLAVRCRRTRAGRGAGT